MTKDVIHQVYRAKPVQTFGDLEANLLRASSKTTTKGAITSNKFNIELAVL
jgi:hypothetical protein